MRFYDGLTFHRVIAGFMAQVEILMETELEEVVKISKLSLMTSSMKEELYLWQEAMILILQIVNSLYVMILTLFWMGNIRHGEKSYTRYESNRENS